MKSKEFQKIIKESVREVFREELRDLLLEAIKSNKGIEKELNEDEEEDIIKPSSRRVPEGNSLEQRKAIRDMFFETQQNMNQPQQPHQVSGYNPPPIDTASEGSALPPGEVSLDQIKSIIKG